MEVRWSQYKKVIDILSKIANNKETVNVDERDEKDLAEYKMSIEKYNDKHLGSRQKANTTAIDFRMRKKQRVYKGSDAVKFLQTMSKQWPADEVLTAQLFSNVAQSDLHMALVDNNSASSKMVREMWSSFEVRLS